jgi:hypothetical protein
VAGPGWALVGDAGYNDAGYNDAGYNKDFITTQGIQDAFRDAELCATALDQTLSGARPFDVAMRDYQSVRDEHVLPLYEFTAELASLEPPPPELEQLLGHAGRPGGHGRVRAGQGRDDLACGVLLRGERRTHPGPGADGPGR